MMHVIKALISKITKQNPTFISIYFYFIFLLHLLG